MLVDAFVAVDDLLDESDGLGLGHAPMAGKKIPQGALAAELGYDVDAIPGLQRLLQLQDITSSFQNLK